MNESFKTAMNEEFNVDDVVEFATCRGALFEVVEVEENGIFVRLEHFGGPQLPENYHKTYFGADPPEMPSVMMSLLYKSNPMEVLAIMQDDK